MAGLPDPRLPGGPLASGWQRCRDGLVGIAPANRRRFELLVVVALQVVEARVSTEKPDVYKDCRVGYEAVRRRTAG